VGHSQNCVPYMGSGHGWLVGDWPSTGAFLTLMRRPGLRASSDGVLATRSERKMLASTCLYSLYAWLCCVSDCEVKIRGAVLSRRGWQMFGCV